MPTIILKHKSPEFEDNAAEVKTGFCDMPGCPHHAEHKAPKHRGLNEYYHFCTDHVREYNKAWDFFSGMSEREVQDHIHKSMYGDRPTWKYGSYEQAEEALHHQARSEYYFGEESRKSEHQQNENRKREFYGDKSSPEYDAMAIMGLSPPVTLDEIKAQYKKLAKKFHPDLNRDNPDAEEALKSINMAYTILKLAFEDYKAFAKDAL